MTFTDPSRNGPTRSVCVTLCFSPEGRMVHAGPLHTPSMKASGAMASRWAEIRAAGSGRPCPGAITVIPTNRIKNARHTGKYLVISLTPSGYARPIEQHTQTMALKVTHSHI